MSPESQRIAIAEACGWTFPDYKWGSKGAPSLFGKDSSGKYGPPPDYLTDLNAMHEAEKVLLGRGDAWGAYTDALMDVIVRRLGYQGAEMFSHATASQRAEAFRKTIAEQGREAAEREILNSDPDSYAARPGTAYNGWSDSQKVQYLEKELYFTKLEFADVKEKLNVERLINENLHESCKRMQAKIDTLTV